MKLNAVEKAVMTSPLRGLVQRHLEARTLEHLGGRLDGGRALELGCGVGVGVGIILERFGAGSVWAIDVDADMVERARARLARHPAERVHVEVGDATAIEAPAAHFDAVFDFGVLHHVVDWQAAVREVSRVLAPGGRFYFEESPRRTLDTWLVRTFTEHPRENRFSAAELVAELARHGIVVGPGRLVRRRLDGFFTGVGIKQQATREDGGG